MPTIDPDKPGTNATRRLMVLRDLLFDSDAIGTATPATVATHETEKSVAVASVATVAVAKAENSNWLYRLWHNDLSTRRAGKGITRH